MDLDEFVKDHYFWELERCAELNEALSVPLGLLTALGGVVAFYTDTFLGNLALIQANLVLGIAVPLSLASSVVTVAVAAVYLVRSRVSLRTYRYVSSAGEFVNYHGALEKHYGDVAKADQGIKALIRERYALGATHNCEHNDYRSNLMNRAYNALVTSVVPLIALTVCYVYLRVLVTDAASVASTTAPLP